MPRTLPQPCRHRGCPNLDCQIHKPKPWSSSVPRERLRGATRQERRRRLFDREPLCRECLKYGRVTVATIRDHLVPLAEGGSEEPDNEQPLCRACHHLKSAAEAQRHRVR